MAKTAAADKSTGNATEEGMEGEEGAGAPPATVHSEFDLRFHVKWKNKGWTLVMGFGLLNVGLQKTTEGNREVATLLQTAKETS